MRVVSGEYRGRNLRAVPGNNTRPTTDKIKESLFNIIGPYFDGGVMLDMYAGSGGIAIEAVSRGMDHAFLCEKNRQALQTIKQNIDITKEEERFTVIPGNVKANLARLSTMKDFEPISLVFLDPPYRLQEISKDIEKLLSLNLLAEDCIIVAEVDKEMELPSEIGEFILQRRVEYGITAIHVYEKE
ncbi:16S rRNA (guanine(966)-N(2))-methyltransferase RsmD [Granulicatella balaenopterae]|uniref:16S rRNA (Guanine(966)-N(2))-methyltransferase RsmD n=1 Tax=Granulicatella balaenopterae TaxID=137733 RepID=A0A1H9IAU5_9LACT|nr:16S rRNA (guanine(966)-N(2))-methyltransferase RsmD [Granulicatella balaenopterae]SEQ71662.1 16S rRNA (guanine(966)-N(2))-methyltransferase RsmD [Granulicatella balaenopterae]